MITQSLLTHIPLVVLGSPGSVCTTFLKVLANHNTYHDVQGLVYRGSLTPDKVASHYRDDLQYSPKDNAHFSALTLEETIWFAAKTRTPLE